MGADFDLARVWITAGMQQRKAVYVPYLLDVYATTYQTNECLDEALANATVLNSMVIKKLVQSLYPKENRFSTYGAGTRRSRGVETSMMSYAG